MADVQRSNWYSESLATKCFAVAWLTPRAWIPLMISLDITPVRYGSSLKYSLFRPPYGVRIMFMPGPHRTWSAHASSSTSSTLPQSLMRSRLNVAADETWAGSAVAVGSGRQSPPRMPVPPLACRKVGMSSEGMPSM